MYDLSSLPVQVAISTTELFGVAATFMFMFAFLAGAIMIILKAYRARAADEELRHRVATLESEVESLNDRLEDR